MIQDNLTNYRVVPNGECWDVIAFNSETNQYEVIKTYSQAKKANAYTFMTLRNNALRHPCHCNNLKSIMLNRNLTAKQLAEMLQRSPYTVASWANNKRQPSYGSILQLCQVLGIRESELVCY